SRFAARLNSGVRPLMKDLQQLQNIAAQLRELQRTSPTDTSDVPAWDTAARSFTENLCIALPAQVMHYLHDADLRAQYPEYRAAQDEMLNGIIADLECGRIPQSTGATISFHPRWLGVAALILVAVVYWVAVR